MANGASHGRSRQRIWAGIHGQSKRKAVTALLSIQDEEEIDRTALAYSPKFQRILQTAKQQIRDDRGIKHREFWREMEAKAK